MSASFTLSEFSELVSTALRGHLFEDDGLPEAPVASRDGGRLEDSSKYTNKHPTDSESNAPYKRLVDASSSNSLIHRSPYTNSTQKMLLVAPPGPLPPPSAPIISASMSTIDLGANCLSLGIGMGSTGCGGTFSKSALEAMDASNTHTTTIPTTQTTTSSPLTPSPSPHRHRPLTLFAKIKRQLSKPNAALPSPSPSPSPTHTTHPNAFLVPITDLCYTPPAEQIRRDHVSFAPSPSFHCTSSTGAESETPETASLMSLSNNMSAAPNHHPKQKKTEKQQQQQQQQQRRRRRRHSSAESDYSLMSLSASMTGTSQHTGSELSFAGPSAYSDESAIAGGGMSLTSYVDVGIPSIIGSSASFFAALDRGRDGRKGRRGSDDEEDSGFIEPASFEGHFDFPDNAGYLSGGRRNSDPDENFADYNNRSQRLDEDARSVHSFVPYLPLVMQHERRQQGLEARVSLEDVASFSARSRSSTASRASTVASRSVSTREPRRSNSIIRTQDRTRMRRHVPPPLYPSAPARSSSSSVHGHPYSPTSSASSRSPITPSTPFFTASEASLEDEDEEEGDSDDASRISPNVTRRSQKDEGNKVLSARLSMDTFGHHTTASFFHPGPKTCQHARLDVHPPTPIMPDLFMGSVSAPHPTSSGEVNPTSPREDSSNHDHHRSTSNASVATRRSRQNLKSKSPPLSPPPSGPLPLLPASPPSTSASLNAKVNAVSSSQRDSLVTQSSAEYSTHRHPSPFAQTLSESENELWEEEAVLNIPGVSSSIAFELQHTATQVVSSGTPHLLFSAHPFVSELSAVSIADSRSSTSAESESEYASFSSSHSHSHSPSHSSSTTSGGESSESPYSDASIPSEETPSESEHRSRAAAILEANTRANADGFFMPVEKIKIEIGRQQALPPKTPSAAVQTRSGDEWTLGLGLAGLKVPQLSYSSSSSSGSSSISKIDEVRVRGKRVSLSPAFPVLAGDAGVGSAAATASTLLVKKKRSTVGSCVTPSIFVTAAADDQRSMRERTKSESALGAGARWKKDVFGLQAKSAASLGPNEDWTLSLPLPSFKKLRKLPADVHDTDPVLSKGRHSYPTRMGGVDILVTDVDASVEDADVTSAENADASSDIDDLSTESGAIPDPEPVILSVPRLVTSGSGIERATSASSSDPRPRTRSITLEDVEVELLEPGYAVAHALAKASADANLAKLNTLSTDLARFNEMLREGGSRLRQGNVVGRHGGVHGSKVYGEERGVNEFLHAGDGKQEAKRGTRSALKHAKSFGVLDEAPPKNTIVRMTSVGDLLSEDSEWTKAKTVSRDFGLSSGLSTTPALIDNSPTLPQPDTPIATQQEPAQGSLTTMKRPSSSGSNASTITPSLARTPQWRNVSGTSGSSSSTVTAMPADTNTKIRVTLPFAPLPSAFAYKSTTKVEVVTGAVGSLVTEGAVPAQTRPGLASGSALNMNRKNSSRTLSRSPSSVKIKTKPVVPVTIGDSSNAPTSEGSSAHQDDTTTATTPTAELSSQVMHSRISISSTSSASTASPVTTPTQASLPLPSLSICTSPLPPPSRPRCQSTSSTCSKDTTHSSATLTPLSLTYDSSTLPTPLASSFPAPPTTNPKASSFGEALRVRLATAGIKSTSSKDVNIPERKSESSPISSSPKATVLTIEERIRRLQELGMEAVVVRSVANSPNSSSVSKAVKKEKEVESDSSDFYYSARSSFSSER